MGNNSPWHRWYQTENWQARRKYQLQISPLCAHCLASDPPIITAAVAVDHVQPHRGDRTAFMTSPLQSLCVEHHARKSNEECDHRVRPIIGADGYAAHPVYQTNK
jgi:5-methylcytosine-specific restriction endonuclease McrA